MMKRFMGMVSVLAVALLFSTCGWAEEKMSEADVAAMEAGLFTNLDSMDTSDSAKFAQNLEQLSGNDGEAKCWFWCWRRPVWFYRPVYYYYSWYCPVYYVPLRIVTYTVPVVTTTPVVTTPVATAPTQVVANQTATATATATASASVIAKSSGQVAKGAVIDRAVPAHSPLAKMGLRAGDIITSVDGNPVNSIVDVRRINANSNITYVRGNIVKVAGKPLLQNTTASVAKAFEGTNEAPCNTDQIKATQNSTMSLYEYYDSLETTTIPASVQEYGADEY